MSEKHVTKEYFFEAMNTIDKRFDVIDKRFENLENSVDKYRIQNEHLADKLQIFHEDMLMRFEKMDSEHRGYDAWLSRHEDRIHALEAAS